MEVQKLLHATQSTEHMCCYTHKHIRVCVNRMVMIMRSASLHQQFDLLETPSISLDCVWAPSIDVIHPELCRIRTWCTSPSEMLCWRQVSVGTAVSDFMSHILSISFPATWHQPASLARLLFRLSSSAGRQVGQVGQVGWSKHTVMFSSVCYNLIDFSYIWRTVSMSFHYSVCMRFSDLIAS